MQKRSLVAKIFVLVGVLSVGAAAARAQEGRQQNFVPASFEKATAEPVQINVLVGQSRVINFDRPIGRFSVSNPEVAEAVLVAPDQVLVNGKAFGQVNFIAWEQKGGAFIIFDVFVRSNLSLIDSQIKALFPTDDVRLSQANGSVVISGSVKQAVTVAQVEAVVKAAGFNTVNMLTSPTASKAQVQLQVRVAEVSRSRMKELGATFAYESQPGVGGSIGSGGGPFTVGKVDGGSIFGTTVGSALNLFVMGGNTFNFLRALKTQGAHPLSGRAEPDRDGRPGGELPRGRRVPRPRRPELGRQGGASQSCSRSTASASTLSRPSSTKTTSGWSLSPRSRPSTSPTASGSTASSSRP